MYKDGVCTDIGANGGFECGRIVKNNGGSIHGTDIHHAEDKELSGKLKYIADCEGRTKNRQVERLIKTLVADFEKEHGPIDVKAYYQGK